MVTDERFREVDGMAREQEETLEELVDNQARHQRVRRLERQLSHLRRRA